MITNITHALGIALLGGIGTYILSVFLAGVLLAAMKANETKEKRIIKKLKRLITTVTIITTLAIFLLAL